MIIVKECCKPWMEEFMAKSIALDELEQKLEKIENWCKAYPLDMFPEPNMKYVREILQTYSTVTIDEISASNMRHVLEGIQKIINSEGEL